MAFCSISDLEPSAKDINESTMDSKMLIINDFFNTVFTIQLTGAR